MIYKLCYVNKYLINKRGKLLIFGSIKKATTIFCDAVLAL